MDYMNGTELHDLWGEQWPKSGPGATQKAPAAHDLEDAAAMRAHSRQHRNACLYLGRVWRVEENHDAEYGAEWRISEAALLADENATLTAQLVDYAATKERLTRERVLRDDSRREIGVLKMQLSRAKRERDAAQAMLDKVIAECDALHVERDTLIAKLDAALEQIAAYKAAEALADDDTTTPAAVRLDRASQRKAATDWTPPVRKPPAA